MNTLEVTDEQYAFVQQLREEISDKVVGKYGTVRERDAVQFLIDNVDADLDVEGLDRDVEALTYEESDDDEVEEAVSNASDPELAEIDEDSEESAVDAGPDDDSDADDADGADDASADEDGAADDDDMLDQMMNLLETHDDKWEESPSADYRYRVTLPDGSTEDVQTKDDVRALLFKNY